MTCSDGKAATPQGKGRIPFLDIDEAANDRACALCVSPSSSNKDHSRERPREEVKETPSGPKVPREGFKAIGLELFSDQEIASDTVTAVRNP